MLTSKQIKEWRNSEVWQELSSMLRAKQLLLKEDLAKEGIPERKADFCRGQIAQLKDDLGLADILLATIEQEEFEREQKELGNA